MSDAMKRSRSAGTLNGIIGGNSQLNGAHFFYAAPPLMEVRNSIGFNGISNITPTKWSAPHYSTTCQAPSHMIQQSTQQRQSDYPSQANASHPTAGAHNVVHSQPTTTAHHAAGGIGVYSGGGYSSSAVPNMLSTNLMNSIGQRRLVTDNSRAGFQSFSTRGPGAPNTNVLQVLPPNVASSTNLLSAPPAGYVGGQAQQTINGQPLSSGQCSVYDNCSTSRSAPNQQHPSYQSDLNSNSTNSGSKPSLRPSPTADSAREEASQYQQAHGSHQNGMRKVGSSVRVSNNDAILNNQTRSGTIANSNAVVNNTRNNGSNSTQSRFPTAGTSAQTTGPPQATGPHRPVKHASYGSNAFPRNGNRATATMSLEKINNSHCFVPDVSCVGFIDQGFGMFTLKETLTTQAYGSSMNTNTSISESDIGAANGNGQESTYTSSLLVSTRGFSSGRHYWEIESRISDSAKRVDLYFGVVPRGLDTCIDINRNIDENGGYSCVLAHGRHLKDGDVVGVYLDLHLRKMSFYVNGRYCADAPSIGSIPLDKPLFPAFSIHPRAAVSSNGINFLVRESSGIPDVDIHNSDEEHAQESRLSYKEELNARRIALSHVGSTIEISSGLTDELRIHVGDAILFVELDDLTESQEWQFKVEKGHVLARDPFYLHREFDLNVVNTQTILKVAFKFVALTPGIAVLKSIYSDYGDFTGGWRQELTVVVEP